MKKQKRISWDPSRSAVDSARTVLPSMARDLFAAGRRAISGKAKAGKLHEFRLQTKRCRYTLELFRPLFGPAIEERLGRLHRLQQHLGAINDCSATRKLVNRAGGNKKSKQKKVLSWLDQTEQDRIQEFLVYWRDTFDAPGEEDRWVNYLRNYVGRGSLR